MLKRILSLAIACAFAIQVKADEGMWLLSTLKKLNEAEMQQMGCKLTAEEIYNVNHSSMKDAIVHFGGFCTGEIVSAEGLILTNHHCGLDAVQGLSTVENDIMTNGFWATSKAMEKPAPGLFVKFLVRMEDVSERVKKETEGINDEAELQKKLPGIFAKITGEAKEGNNYTADVKAMYGGNEYYLFVYETYNDVRLVGVPPFAIGNFGGDTDNWIWPRHTGDFSMFRVYTSPDGKPAQYSKDNVPMKSKYFLPISTKGVKEGDYAMTVGYPGRTDRYATSYSVNMGLEVTSPAIVKLRDKKLKIMNDAMSKSDEVRIKYQAKKNNISNYWKYFIGQMKQLKRMNVPEQKRTLETQFNNWVAADAGRKTMYGDVTSNLKRDLEQMKKYALYRTYLNEAVFGPEVMPYANTFQDLEKMLDDKTTKPEDLQKKTDDLKKDCEEHFKENDAAVDQKIFAAMMESYFNDIPKENQTPEFIEMAKKYDNNFEEFAEAVFKKSIFVSKEKTMAFLNSPSSGKLKKDMAYKLVTAMFNHYTNVIRPVMKPLEQSIAKSNRAFIKGLREMNADKKYSPDANGTMRLSYGTIKTYEGMDAISYKHYTTMEGIMQKKDNSNPEFIVPMKLEKLYEAKDFGNYAENGVLKTCFLTTNDITGGNSGSPVINGNGELIGLAFDGNWEAMSGDIKYDPEYKRTICVDIRYVLFCIDKLGGATNIISELKMVQ